MSTKPSTQGVPIDLDPVPDFVQAVQDIWEQLVPAWEQFREVPERLEKDLNRSFPLGSDDSWKDGTRIARPLEVSDEKLMEVAKNLLKELIERAEELFTKAAVRLEIDPESYIDILEHDFDTRDAESSPYRKHQTVIESSPECVDFCKIWRKLEVDFSGAKSQTKTYRDAAQAIIDAGSGYGLQEKDEWIKLNVTKQKKQTVIKFPAHLEEVFDSGEYRYSHHCKERIVALLSRGIAVLADFIHEEDGTRLKMMMDSLTRTLWSNFRLGFKAESDIGEYHLTFIIRKSKLEMKMDHEFADVLLKFLNEHYFQVEESVNA